MVLGVEEKKWWGKGSVSKKLLTAKPDDLSLIPVTYKVERESQLPCKSSSDLRMYAVAHAHPHTYMHTVEKWNVIFKIGDYLALKLGWGLSTALNYVIS